MAIEFQEEDVTPQQAKDWLERNVHNRTLKRTVVDRLAGAMERGEFLSNGETLKFDKNGNLIDGQHRLAAVVQSGVTVRLAIARGVEAAAQETVDLGSKRTIADLLKLRGEANTNQLGAALSWLWRYRRRQMRDGPPDPTPQELLQVLQQHPDIRSSLPVGRRLRSVRYPPALGTFAHYAFMQVDEEEANWFLDRLHHGAGLERGDPILALRHTLERRAMVATYQVEMPRLAALTFKAWKAVRADRRVELLAWRSTGPRAEPFPYLDEF